MAILLSAKAAERSGSTQALAPLNGDHRMWNSPTDKQPNYIAIGLCLGVAFGAAIGVALGNFAYGMGPGIALGVALGAVAKKNASRSAGEDTKSNSDGL